MPERGVRLTERAPCGTNTSCMSGESARKEAARWACECVGCNSRSHDGHACAADFTVNGKLWERRTWAEHIDKLLCPECWVEIAANQTPEPGIVS